MRFPKLSPEQHDGPARRSDERLRASEDFAILHQHVDGHRRVFLDNAATTQKSTHVAERVGRFYARENFHAKSAAVYAKARRTVAGFIGAAAQEVVFLRGATDAIALVADTWGRDNIGRGDEILVSSLEHQANLLPWRRLASCNGATLRVVPAQADGDLRAEAFETRLTPRTRLVAVTQVSNVMGTIAPIKAIAAAAHGVGARVLVDGAQAVAHFAVDVKDLGADFYTFSAHKVFGPTGVGVLFADRSVMASEGLETGTSDIAGAAGLAKALEILLQITPGEIARHEQELLDHLCRRLQEVPDLRRIGTAKNKVPIQSFVIEGIAPHAIQAALERKHVEVQSGAFSAPAALEPFGLDAAVRVSLAFYKTLHDVDFLVDALRSLSP